MSSPPRYPRLTSSVGSAQVQRPPAHCRVLRSASGEVFSAPLSPGEALGNITALLSLSHARAVSEREGFLAANAHVVGDVAVRGNLVPDGHVAAILFQHGVRTLYTNDRDFWKFESLDVKNPFA
jgi:uncharacterized protein